MLTRCLGLVAVLTMSALPALAAESSPEQSFGWELQKLPLDATEIRAAPVGAVVPDSVLLTDVEGKEQSLSQHLAGRTALVVFYRGGWCPFCTTQLSGLNAIQDDIQAHGVDIVGISPDRHTSLAEAAAKHELEYQLLSDASLSATSRFGLGFALDEETIERYQGFDIPLTTNAWGQTVLPVPALYLIDGDGTVRWRYYDADFRERPDNDVVLAAVAEVMSKDQGAE